ncbi:topoisomerase DNA-binding C4 zinc finger domain-containing protein [Halorhabdus rudnickae]|uniref:topoisomerase DNA-binding C4 zinc finger domain-containing protein n=1 Tax=Halorhabdus rudnickae TaxID=1775544 RepID=UPI001438511E|nr:topoisomerase DNA-binding C4 zinc finger domain-containing protein [Halorhabdus rudnickae]
MAEHDTSTARGRQYHRISKAEFEQNLGEMAEYERVDYDAASELVYDIPLPVDHLTIRVFSTIQEGASAARDCGNDAIRCVVWHQEADEPIGGREKTLRLKTWAGNLREKMADLMARWRDYDSDPWCDECGSALTLQDGPYGQFLACTDYHCEHTKDLP